MARTSGLASLYSINFMGPILCSFKARICMSLQGIRNRSRVRFVRAQIRIVDGNELAIHFSRKQKTVATGSPHGSQSAQRRKERSSGYELMQQHKRYLFAA